MAGRPRLETTKTKYKMEKECLICGAECKPADRGRGYRKTCSDVCKGKLISERSTRLLKQARAMNGTHPFQLF